MKHIFIRHFVAFWILVFATINGNAQVYKVTKIQLGYQESAVGLFTCDNLKLHFTHVIVENIQGKPVSLSFYNSEIMAKPYSYRLTNPRFPRPGQVVYDAERSSPHGCLWTKITITSVGKKASIRFEYAADQWGGKIYYVYTAKIQKSNKGLENFIREN